MGDTLIAVMFYSDNESVLVLAKIKLKNPQTTPILPSYDATQNRSDESEIPSFEDGGVLSKKKSGTILAFNAILCSI